MEIISDSDDDPSDDGQSESTFRCKTCGKDYSSKINLRNHMKTHNEPTFQCPICPYVGKTKKYVNRHKLRVHKEVSGPACQVCGKKFHFQSNLDIHMRVHTGEKPYACNFCEKTFRVPYSLKTHMLIHENLKPFKCSFCNYECRDSSTLRKHQNKHMGIKKMYSCTICKKSYDQKTKLKTHVSRVHLEIDVKAFGCDQCNKFFQTKALLRSHINIVHNRLYECVCPICDKTITCKNNLAVHIRTHTQYKPFICTFEDCKARFKDKSTLKKHVIIHTPSLHHACDKCDAKFSRKIRLWSHMKTHEPKEKNVICDYCKVSFYTKNYLIKHIKVKHAVKKKKYICDKCGFKTYNKPSIVMHVKYRHEHEDDKECKICGSRFKLHEYLKVHYLRTHNIMYKQYKRKLKNKLNATVEVKVEPMDASDVEIDLHVKQFDDFNECLQYSQQVLCEDVTATILDNNSGSNEFDRFVIEHMFKTPKNEEAESLDVDREQLEKANKQVAKIMKKAEKKNQELRKKKEKKLLAEQKEREAKILLEKRKNENKLLEDVRKMYNERIKNITVKQNKETIRPFKAKTTDDKNKSDSAINKENKSITKNTSTSDKNKTKSIDTIINDKNESETANNAIDESLTTSAINNENGPNATDNTIDDEYESTNLDDVINDENKSADSELNDENDLNEIETGDMNKSIATSKSVNDNELTTMDTNDINDINDENDPSVICSDADGAINDENHPTDSAINDENGPTDRAINNDNDPITADGTINNDNDKITADNPINDENNHIHGNINDENELFNITPSSSSNNINDNNLKRLRKRTKRIQTDERELNEKKSNKLNINLHQCYTCFKLFSTKEDVIKHCQIHFDVCSETTLIKCPICNFVAPKKIAKHMLKAHDVDIKISYCKIKRTEESTSKYCYETNDATLEIIPSVKILNKTAYMALDNKKRLSKDQNITKTKLVKKGKEWIVENVPVTPEFDLLPEFNQKDYSKLEFCDNDVDRLGEIGRLARKRGIKMAYPCFNCDKICQNFSALKLHKRKHEDYPKPFRPRGQKIKKQVTIISHRTQKPKPIKNKHKCDDKLKEFYEKNIRGGDIEFWQFLKIYNKIERENVTQFEDLVGRTDFGIHCKEGADTSSIKTGNRDIKNSKTTSNRANTEKKRSKNKRNKGKNAKKTKKNSAINKEDASTDKQSNDNATDVVNIAANPERNFNSKHDLEIDTNTEIIGTNNGQTDTNTEIIGINSRIIGANGGKVAIISGKNAKTRQINSTVLSTGRIKRITKPTYKRVVMLTKQEQIERNKEKLKLRNKIQHNMEIAN